MLAYQQSTDSLTRRRSVSLHIRRKLSPDVGLLPSLKRSVRLGCTDRRKVNLGSELTDHSPPKWSHGGHAFLRELAKRVVTQAPTLCEREVRRLVRFRLLLALHELIKGLGDNRLAQSTLILLGRLAHDAARAEVAVAVPIGPLPPLWSLYSCRLAAWVVITFPITRAAAIVFANRLSLPMSSSRRSRVWRSAEKQILPRYFSSRSLRALLQPFLQSPAESAMTLVDHRCASHLVQCIDLLDDSMRDPVALGLVLGLLDF